MRVTIGGIEYEITVTDDALYAININPYISDGSIVSIEVGDNSYTGDSLQNNSITAAENDTVTVTVKPAQDYYTENLSVSNSNITVNKDESNPNVFSFTMINASVTVGANFHLLSERVKATAVPSDGGTAMINPTGDDLFSIYNVSQGNPVDVRVKSNDGYSIRDVKYTYNNANNEQVIGEATLKKNTVNIYTFNQPGADTLVTARFWKPKIIGVRVCF